MNLGIILVFLVFKKVYGSLHDIVYETQPKTSLSISSAQIDHACTETPPGINATIHCSKSIFRNTICTIDEITLHIWVG